MHFCKCILSIEAHTPHIISRKCYCNMNRMVSIVLGNPQTRTSLCVFAGVGGDQKFSYQIYNIGCTMLCGAIVYADQNELQNEVAIIKVYRV